MVTRLPSRGSLALVPAAVLLVGAALAGCAHHDGVEPESPVSLSPVPGTALKEVHLTAEAVQRLGITTAPVGTGTLPYSAVVYDTDGSTWAYVQEAAGTYLRSRLVVARIEGDRAVLTSGPQPGTPVVVVGAPELLGAEYEISGEQ